MMNGTMKKWLIAGLLLVAAVQCAIPAFMIVVQEDILRNGTEYKFRTAPVDPYDVFRGRYVNLNIEYSRIKQDGRNFRRGEKVYANVEVDPEGFAKIVSVSRSEPTHGEYFMARIAYGWDKEIMLDLPFSRYYLKENHAPQAEKLYRGSTKNKNAWITIRIKNGQTALNELYIDGKPIREALQPAPKP